MAFPTYLNWLAEATPTAWWHDSADPAELVRALEWGAAGVTTNPILVNQALRSNPDAWRSLLGGLDEHLSAEERAIARIQAVTIATAARLEPRFRAAGGDQGYVCAQVNPARAGDRDAMLVMARRFHAWAPNIAVKLPVTLAGLDVLEECTAEGITVTATVSFTVPQAVAVAERHRRGAARARQSGIQPGRCFAVIMIGRQDDYLRDLAADNRAGWSEAEIRQAGLAVTKQAYQIYQREGWEAVLLVAALRGVYHMTGLAGGKLVMSIHPKIQAMLLEPGVARQPGIDEPVDPQVVQRLLRLAEFRRAYDPQGMAPADFFTYGLTQRTLAQFNEGAWAQLENLRI